MELDVVPVNFLERFRPVFPGARFSDATPLIRKVRMVKTHYEIHLIKDAARQVDMVYRRAKEVIREGMSDLDLAAELEHAARKDGHQGLVRMELSTARFFMPRFFPAPTPLFRPMWILRWGGSASTPPSARGQP